MIHIVAGKPKRVDDGAFDVEVSIDLACFSSHIMRVVDFKKLWEYGLVEVSDASYVDQLNRLFRVQRKPVTIEEF